MTTRATDGQHIALGGVQLWYFDTGGDGEAVVLLHAATGSVRVWEHQVDALTTAGFRVVAFDRRGWGRTLTNPDAAPGTAADDLRALADHLRIDRMHLLGTAAGVIVAFDFALSFPERLRSLIVANSHGGIQDAEAIALNQRLRPPAFAALPEELKELGPEFRASNPDGTRRWIELHEANRPESARAAIQPTRHSLTYTALEAISAPTLVIAGDADLYSPPAVMRAFASCIKNASVTVLSGAGHSAYWEQPAAFNHAVLEFLRGDSVE